MRKIISVLFIIGCFCSCSKDFLDKEPTNYISQSKLLSTSQGVKSSLIGCYSEMQSSAYYGRNFVLIGDVYSDNAKLSSLNTGDFSSFYNYSVTNDDEYLNDFWSVAYKIIKNANNILALKSDATRTDIDSTIYGEALAIRSLAYFDLVRMFAHKYSYDNSGIPIANDTIQNPERSTVKQVYAQIISDLKQAEIILENAEVTPYRFNKTSVEALLTIVYMFNNEYTNAITYGEKVIASNQYSLLTAENYMESWSQESSTESIFSVSESLTDNTGTNSIGHMLSPDGYGGIVPTEDLLSLFSDSDIRTSFIKKRSEKFYMKYPGRNNNLGIDNIPVIRLSEIYFILAECYVLKASSNPDYFTKAQEIMSTLTQRVDPTIVISNLSDIDLYMKIYEEYRKEFAFEGKRFFQLKRSTFGISRSDCNSMVCDVVNPSYLFAFPIPIAELNANSKLEQNKGY